MKKISIILIMLLVGLNSFAQDLTQTIKGKVIDKQSLSTLPGATIMLEGTDPIIGTT